MYHPPRTMRAQGSLPEGNPARAAGVLVMVALATKATGFLRVAAFAGVLGASAQGDAFLTAFLVPEVLYLWFTEGGTTAALVRVLVHHPDPAVARRLAALAGVLGILMGAGLWWGAGGVVDLVAPGFPADTRTLAESYLRLVAVYVPLTLVYFVLQAASNARGRFLAPALGPLFFNLALLAAAALGRRLPQPGEVLCLGVVAGGLIQCLGVLLPHALGSRRAPEVAPVTPGATLAAALTEVVTVAVPTAVLVGLMQLQFVFERFLLSRSAVGTITRFATAQKLVNLPLGLVAVTLATALVPYLARRALQRGPEALLPGMRVGLRVLVWVMVPITALTAALSLEAVTLVFGRGRFGSGDLYLTARLVEVAAPATLFMALSLLLVRGFLAAGDGRTPARVKGVAVAGLVLADALTFPLLGPRVLWVNAALAGLFEALVLVAWLPGASWRQTGDLLGPLLRALLPALAGFACVRLLLPEVSSPAGAVGWLPLAGVGGAGLLAFVAVGWLLGAPSPRALLGELRELRAET